MLTQAMRVAGVVSAKKKDRNVDFIGESLSQAYRRSPSLLQSLDCIIHAEEFRWLTSHQRIVLFLETSQLARAIMKSSFSIQNEEALFDGSESFIVCLPDDLMFGKQKIGSGLLVNILADDEAKSGLLHPFCEWIKMPPVDTEFDASFSKFGVYVCYRHFEHSNEYMRLCLPAKNIIQALQYKNYREYRKFLREINNFNYLGDEHLDPNEMDYQFDLLKFVAGLLLYKKALPERIKPGYPAMVKNKTVNSPMIRDLTPVQIMPPEGETRTKEGHYRQWHFRQLSDARFYRGKYKKLTKGTRLIFIKNALVNMEIEAKTVIKG